MNYKRITQDIFLPETSTPEPISISKLEEEIQALKALIFESEPTDAELLLWARAFHPYYSENGLIQSKIIEKQNLIDSLRAL